MTEQMAEALAKRGRTWGEQNRAILLAIRSGVPCPRRYGGPTLEGRSEFSIVLTGPFIRVSGYRRYAPPAP